MGGFLWEDFFGRIFLGGFFGRIFLRVFFERIVWEEFFVRNYFVEIKKELMFLSRFWVSFVSMQKKKKEEERT